MDVGTQIFIGAIISTLLGGLKKSSWFPWLTQETAQLNRIVAIVVSGLATIGVHYSYNQGTLIVTNLTWAVIGHGVWHWLTQALATHGWYKATSSSDQILKLLQALLAQSQVTFPVPTIPSEKIKNPAGGPTPYAGAVFDDQQAKTKGQST